MKEVDELAERFKPVAELGSDVDAYFGQEVCCDILPKYGVTDENCYQEIIGLAYKLADTIANIQNEFNKEQILSHPDLALIDRERVFKDWRMGRTLKAMGCSPVIPLADTHEEE